MPNAPILIPAGPGFWPLVARMLLAAPELGAWRRDGCDLSAVRVLVPAFVHAQALKSALADEARRPLIPPRITTLDTWLAQRQPADAEASRGERMMSLYAELRQHGWLKKLFSARRNTDLLPLAQTLLGLFDELSAALLPALRGDADAADSRWQAALESLPPPARTLLSDEAQLVWTLWKSQLDGRDPVASAYEGMMRVADDADEPLVWVGADPSDPLREAFLEVYARRRPVLRVGLDWQSVPPVLAQAWPEVLDDGAANDMDRFGAAPAVFLHAAQSLEAEARHAAGTIIEWLREGRGRVALIAQDRVVARRVRALLERAQVFVADETGWRLSTTRSAAALDALLEVAATDAETLALLDLLKAPCVCPGRADKAERVMEIELALRRRNVPGGWQAALSALERMPEARDMLEQVAEQVRTLTARRTLEQWSRATGEVLQRLGMRAALEADAAGAQVVALLDLLAQDCAGMPLRFSLAEWRAFLDLQLEATPFVPEAGERRVMVLQLNGARLRSFDAVLMVGADAAHLPSRTGETLFFGDGVRRELGLATREQMQRQQLRDLAGLLANTPVTVLSWQATRNGEPNAPSHWLERLELAFERAGLGPLPRHALPVAKTRLYPTPIRQPAPSAPQLLPRRLSASAWNSLAACPYQFFAGRMLRLDALEELSDLPEKRDYGEWLHAILRRYHETVRERQVGLEDRAMLLREISDQVFGEALSQGAAALGFYIRWQKAMPAYLDWAHEREAQGWRFVLGEQHFEKTLVWDDGQITLHGYVDRIDENGEGERAVLDYKTRGVQALRDKLREGDDHQLAFYALLSDLPVQAGVYVALELTRERTGDTQADDFDRWQAQLETRIVATLRAIAAGAPLPATGVQQVCAWCDMRGLCRKGAW